MTVTEIKTVEDILELESRYATMKAEAIKGLLKEREDLETNTALRLRSIRSELQALGYKVPRPRKPK